MSWPLIGARLINEVEGTWSLRNALTGSRPLIREHDRPPILYLASEASIRLV